MIISHKHKFVFLHNPKVAGTAIRQVLESLHDDDTNFWHQGFVPELDRVTDLAHLTWREIRRIRPEVEDYESMVVVRNPYKRFLSGLQEHWRQHGCEMPHTGTEQIDSWLENHADETNFRWNWKYIHLCPQHYFVPPTGTTWVLKHETLNTDWLAFQRSMAEKGVEIGNLPVGVRARPDVPGTLTVDNLSDFAIEVLNNIYHHDFKSLDYPRIGTDQSSKLPAWDHYERVNGIHNPYLPAPDKETLTDGERIAYRLQVGTRSTP